MGDEADGAQAESGVEACAPVPKLRSDKARVHRDIAAEQSRGGSLVGVSVVGNL